MKGLLNSKIFIYLVLFVAVIMGLSFLLRQLKQTAKDAAAGVGGLLNGKNELTKGTAYEGAGVFGTLGAAANEITGGALGGFGSWIGGKLADGRDAISGSTGIVRTDQPLPTFSRENFSK